jgi:hypothetical protein
MDSMMRKCAILRRASATTTIGAALVGLTLMFNTRAGAQEPAVQSPPAAASVGSRRDLGNFTTWILQNRSYFDPLVSEDHAPDVNILFFASSSRFQYATTPGRRRAWNISLGKEVPVIGWERVIRNDSGQKETCNFNSSVPRAGCFGMGGWFAVGFHMIEDFKDKSAPIVDTDYRFGGIYKLQYRLKLARDRDNTRDFVDLLGFRLYYGHESTHLGDEFSLAAQRNRDVTDFQRINVSYQYWEYGVSYELRTNGRSLIARHTGSVLDGLFTHSWDTGYYSTDPLETNGHPVTPSTNRYEPGVGLEYWDSGKSLLHALNFVSTEARWRTIYSYNKSNATASDPRDWSVNVATGLKHNRRPTERGLPDPYLRVYYGVNPAGQLRNQRHYLLFGIGVHVGV